MAAGTSPTDVTDAMQGWIVGILKENPTIPGLESFASKPDDITVEDDPIFSEGYVNYILRLKAGDGRTLIAKYAPPYVKSYGEEMSLSSTRAELEMTALQLYEQHSPGSAPKPYFYSSKHSTILMEDLAGYKMLRSELLAGNVNKVAIGTITVHMARIHRATHKDNVSAQEWSKLQELLDKHLPMLEGMCETFTSYPYIKEPDDDVATQLKDRAERDASPAEMVKQLVQDYLHCQECLIHADPNTRDVLVKGDDAKFIDPEFAHLGPGCSDAGVFLAYLIMAYYYHLVSPEDNDHHRRIAYKIQDCCQHMVNTYVENMFWNSGKREDHVAKLFKDVAAFAGMELYRSVCSGEQKQLGASQIEMLDSAIRLLKQYHVVDSVDKMIYIALALG